MTADRTLQNAADAIAASLSKSDLVSNVEALSATDTSVAYRVEGHLEGEPEARFAVELTVS